MDQAPNRRTLAATNVERARQRRLASERRIAELRAVRERLREREPATRADAILAARAVTYARLRALQARTSAIVTRSQWVERSAGSPRRGYVAEQGDWPGARRSDGPS
jgi:hypothetical protein